MGRWYVRCREAAPELPDGRRCEEIHWACSAQGSPEVAHWLGQTNPGTRLGLEERTDHH